MNKSEETPQYKVHDGPYPLLYELMRRSDVFIENNTEKVRAYYRLIPSSYQFLSAYNYDRSRASYRMNEIDIIMYMRNIIYNPDKAYQVLQVMDTISQKLAGRPGVLSFFNDRKSYSGNEDFNDEVSGAIQTLVSFMYKNPKAPKNFVKNIEELEEVIDPNDQFDKTQSLVALYVANAMEKAQTPLSHVRFDHNVTVMSAKGYYDSINNSIILSPYHTNVADFTSTLVHESLHYLTVDTIRNPKTKEQKEAIERLTKFQSDFAKDLERNNEQFRKAKEAYRQRQGVAEEDMIYYPFITNSIDELVVALFDQPKFRKWAKSFEYKGDDNLLNKLMSLLGDLFSAMGLNIKPKDGNLSLEYMLADASVLVNSSSDNLIKGNAANMNYVNYKGNSYIAHNYNDSSSKVDLVRVKGNEVETLTVDINEVTVTRSDVSLSKDGTGRILTPRSIIDPKKKTVVKRDEMKQESLLSKYTLHSGGAKGSDYFWSTIGNKFGMATSRHYYVEGYKTTNGNTPVTMLISGEADPKILKANKTLKRVFPTRSDYVNSLLRRNWMQVKNSDAVFAIGRIGEDNLVEGSTGWAVQIAIDENKPVHVYDMNDNQWKKWNNNQWDVITTPILTPNFAGIGSREITPEGVQAIRDVYNTTEANLQNDVLFLPSTFNALNQLDEC